LASVAAFDGATNAAVTRVTTAIKCMIFLISLFNIFDFSSSAFE